MTPNTLSQTSQNQTSQQTPLLHPALAWFVQDHDALMPALVALEQAAETQTLPSQALLQHLHDHMTEHFGLEETVLFPAVPFTPSAVLLLAEHDQLWQLWHAMANACKNEQPDWPDTLTRFYTLMRQHIHEENACLLPSCQRDMAPEHLIKLQRNLDNAERVKHWQERPALPRVVTLLPLADSDRIQYQIQTGCRVEWVNLPKGKALKPHVSPHAQTVLLLSGQVSLVTPCWTGNLTTPGQAVRLDAVVSLAATAIDHSRLLLLKAPVVYPLAVK